VYSYTRQQLTGKTIYDNNRGVYQRMQELQTALSLFFAGLPMTKEYEVLKPKEYEVLVLRFQTLRTRMSSTYQY
jgi:hypothetical protein